MMTAIAINAEELVSFLVGKITAYIPLPSTLKGPDSDGVWTLDILGLQDAIRLQVEDGEVHAWHAHAWGTLKLTLDPDIKAIREALDADGDGDIDAADAPGIVAKVAGKLRGRKAARAARKAALRKQE